MRAPDETNGRGCQPMRGRGGDLPNPRPIPASVNPGVKPAPLLRSATVTVGQMGRGNWMPGRRNPRKRSRRSTVSRNRHAPRRGRLPVAPPAPRATAGRGNKKASPVAWRARPGSCSASSAGQSIQVGGSRSRATAPTRWKGGHGQGRRCSDAAIWPRVHALHAARDAGILRAMPVLRKRPRFQHNLLPSA